MSLTVTLGAAVPLFAFACSSSPIAPAGKDANGVVPVDTFTYDGNPLFWGADPAAHVWADGQMWIYPTTDIADWSRLNHYDAWSSRDLRTWVAHRYIFSASQCGWCVNFAWAPDVAYKNGKYYLYYYFENGGKEPHGVGVAVSDAPQGPFTNATVNGPLIDGHDPAVFIDDDGQAYIYFGPWAYYLADDMVSLQEEDGRPRRASLHWSHDPLGKYEAFWMFKRKGLYYYALSDDDYRRISYYTGPTAIGPFTYRGTILPTTEGQVVHCSIVRWQDRWILFYHQWPSDAPDHRRVYAEWLTFNDDGTIRPVSVTRQGIEGGEPDPSRGAEGR